MLCICTVESQSEDSTDTQLTVADKVDLAVHLTNYIQTLMFPPIKRQLMDMDVRKILEAYFYLIEQILYQCKFS